MSTQTYQDFFEAMASAKAAMDKLPTVEDALRSKEYDLHLKQQAFDELEVRFANMLEEMNGLKDKVRSLEVERDDAGFRELEALEKLEMVLGTMRMVHGAMADTLTTAKPKAEATTTVEPDTTTIPSVEPTLVQPVQEPVDQIHVASNGAEIVAEPSPTPTITDWGEPKIMEVAEPGLKPYVGMPGFDKPNSVSWADFLAGGGIRPYWLTDEEVERDAVARSDAISASGLAA